MRERLTDLVEDLKGLSVVDLDHLNPHYLDHHSLIRTSYSRVESD